MLVVVSVDYGLVISIVKYILSELVCDYNKKSSLGPATLGG